MKTFIITFLSLLILGILALVFFEQFGKSNFKNTEEIQEVTFDISWLRAEDPKYLVLKKESDKPFRINGKMIGVDEPSIKEVYALDTQRQTELYLRKYGGLRGGFMSRGENFTLTAKVKVTPPKPGTDYYSLSTIEIMNFNSHKTWCIDGYLC